MPAIKGWAIYAHPLFLDKLQQLIDAVEAEKAKKPVNYVKGANAKLLAAILKLCEEVIPSDPTLPKYRQGDTLGTQYRHWFRAKFGGQRFRLFFRYSNNPKIIMYVWVNDSDTKRTYGAKTDAYRVFRSMLKSDNPPDDWDALKRECRTTEGSVLDVSLSRARGVLHK